MCVLTTHLRAANLSDREAGWVVGYTGQGTAEGEVNFAPRLVSW